MEMSIKWFWFIFLYQLNQFGVCEPNIENVHFLNRTTPSERQLYDFKLKNPEPIGLLTTSHGLPVEIRDTFTLNTNQFKNQFHMDVMTNFANPKIPERVVHAKGTGAWGYFVLQHDVSKYTSADIFNGVGKITPTFVRFSQSLANIGGHDFGREPIGLSVKFYTKEGNLDFLCLNLPVFLIKDSLLFSSFVTAAKRNTKTNRVDYTMLSDFITKRAESLHALFWLMSNYGISNGYRKVDYFPVHTYEMRNKYGDKYFVRFNFRSAQGIEVLSNAEANSMIPIDPDYYNTDLYDAIEEKNYPAWNLEIDILTYSDVLHCNYDPFDGTRLWKKGTFETVPIGQLILNKNPDNFFRDVEQSTFNPGNLVPGIPGPIDSLFRLRRINYRDAHIRRLGVNHNRIHVNVPLYRKEYNRDGMPPVLENMNDTPMYYPNSFNGPVPYVDEGRPKYSLSVLQSTAVDLDQPASFYHNYVTTEDHKDRFVNNTIQILLPIALYMQRRLIRLYSLTDPNLGDRLVKRLIQAQRDPGFAPPKVIIPPRIKTFM